MLWLKLAFLFATTLPVVTYAQQAPTPGQNVNMVSGMTWPYGDPFLERQDEPSLAVSTRNPLHLLAGANDYRTVDLNTLLESEPGEVSLCPTAGVTPCPPSAEPWVGQYISIDGGARWQSTLLPGYPQDGSRQGLASPVHGFSTAADPVIASGTNGMFYYGGIAFNRGTSQGLVFVARYMDLNNKENGDITQDSFPVRYIDTLAVAHGSSVPANFLDKPAIAVDIPRGSGTCTINVPQAGGPVQQTIPAGNVYVAYANVATSTSGNIASTIYFTRSTNCGQSWSTPQAISQGYNISQGATIQIDPETGTVYVAWRMIHSGVQQHNDGIAIAASLDGGNKFFPPLTLVSLPPFNPGNPKANAFFDQGTTLTSFRTTAYPAMAVADSGIAFVPGPLYLAWSQRGMGLNGEAEARIMMLAIPGNASLTSSGFKPPSPFVVDNGAITNDIGGTFPLLTNGFQVMPAMTFNQGKLMLIYYDLRQDHTTGAFTPSVSLTGDFMPDANGNFFEEARDQIPENATCDVPLYFISDACLTKRRKTIDLVLAQSNGGLGVPTFTYSRVSHYDFGLFAGETANAFHQVKYDPPNLPMFAKGLAAFLGDYLGITGQPFVLVRCGNWQCWTYNNPSPPGVAGTSFAAPKPAPASPVHYATWTSNQDVIPPVDNDWTTYIPITSGTSVYNGTPTQACIVGTNNGHEGDRNQNVYSSRITQGLSITSPQTSKPLSSTVQRGFVILLQNQSSGRPASSGFVNYFRLSIANQPVNGFASFAQLVPPSPVRPPPFPVTNANGIPFPQASVDVAIAPHTGVARTVFAVSSNPTASILVNVTEMDSLGAGSKVVPGGLSGFILLNADGTVPTSLVDPNVPSGDPNNISNVELYDPNVSAPNVSAPNVSAPNVSAPNVSAPNVSAPNVSAPNVSAPNVSAPNVSAYGVANPNVSAPNVSAPNVSAAPPSDGTYTVQNNRNTNASYNVAVIGQTSTRLQLLLSQIYMTPQTDGQCNLIAQQQNITLANVPNTPITPPDQLSNLTTPNVSAVPVTSPSFSLGPGDTAYITLRGNVDQVTMKQILTQVAPVIIPQAINSNNTTSTMPPIIAPLFITTAMLPNAVVGGQQYNPGVQLQAIGGTLGSGTCSDYFWNWSGAFDSGTPPGLTLSASGLISGTPTTPGTYNVLVTVGDCARNRATRVLIIRVLAPLAITTTSLPAATQGIGNAPVILFAGGGTGSYNWTPVNVDGMSLNGSGVLSGTPTATGTFPFTATVSDSGPPVQTVSQLMTLTVVPATPPAPPSSTLLCDTFNFTPVTQQAGGPPTPTTCTFSAPTMITQVATYQYNGGNGAAPGTISLQIPVGNTLGPFTATGVAGQSGPNEAWVATPNVVVPAGISTVINSGAATWSFNTASNKAGFVRMWGFPVQVSTLTFLTQPANAATGTHIFPAVQVQALDNNNQPLPFIPVTIGLGTNPGTGSLSGTLTQTTSQQGIDPSPFGIATFPDLAIDTAGTGYTLVTSVNQVTATSKPFSIINATVAFPAGFVPPFTTVFSIAKDSAGDAFVVGGRPNGGIVAGLQLVPLPSALNEQFSNPVTLETNYTVPAYVPTVAERLGDFSAYAGLTLIDPQTGMPFQGNRIPANRLDTIFAWRIPPHNSVLPQYACSFESTLKSIEGTVPTSIKFQNQTTGTGNVSVYWIDYSGQRVFYNSLGPGQSYVQQTFLTHPWVATDGANNANNCLGIWLPTESSDTAVITGSASSPAPPANLTGNVVFSGSAPSVVLAWSASTSAVVGYNVYRATVRGGPYTKLTSVPTTNLSFTDTTVGFLAYYYVVASVDAGNVESPYSNEVSVAILL